MQTVTAHISRRCRPFVASAVLVPPSPSCPRLRQLGSSSPRCTRFTQTRTTATSCRVRRLLRMAGQALRPPASGPRVPERPTHRSDDATRASIRHRHLGSRRNRGLRGRGRTGHPHSGREAVAIKGATRIVRLLAHRAGRPRSTTWSASTNCCGHVLAESTTSTLAERDKVDYLNPLRAGRHRPVRRPDAADRRLSRVPSRRARKVAPEPERVASTSRRGLRYARRCSCRSPGRTCR